MLHLARLFVRKTKPMKQIRIGNTLKLARVAAELTQEELAEKAGVTRQTIGLIEAGKYNPSLKLCLLLAKFTNTTLNDLFWIEGEPDG
jgi:putative transcriptional regulator